MSDVYDGVFRTIVNDCKQFLLPYLNEVFGEHYTGKEIIEFHPNEHFIDQQDQPDLKKITDTNFSVIGDTVKKYHLECESSIHSNRMLIRLFEYDAQIALDDAEIGSDKITVTFPNTSVLYLRNTSRTPDRMEVEINVPGDQAKYQVPVTKMVNYSINEIFEKKLYLLIPFYIFVYESSFSAYNNDHQRLKELTQEFKGIVERLDALVEKKEMDSFDRRLIVELSEDVIKELTKKYDTLKQEVGEVMCGALIETESRKIRNAGIEIGQKQGIDLGKIQAYAEIIEKGYATIEDIAEDMNISAEKLEEYMEKNGIEIPPAGRSR